MPEPPGRIRLWMETAAPLVEVNTAWARAATGAGFPGTDWGKCATSVGRVWSCYWVADSD